MISVTKIIEWDMGHRVPFHNSKCKNAHGHRYRLEASFAGDIIPTKGSSSEGMVMDFGDIKQLMMSTIHDPLDHGFMCYNEDPLKDTLIEMKLHTIVVPFIPTAENILQEFIWPNLTGALVKAMDKMQGAGPGRGVWIKSLKLYETPNSYAELSHT